MHPGVDEHRGAGHPDDGGIAPSRFDCAGVMRSTMRETPRSPSPEAPKPGLTISKIVAGAGAAVTSAVVGSAFGADGTVVGAAVGSVVSAVAAVAYERSLDRTREVVVSRVRLPNGRTAEVTQVIPIDATQVIPAQRAAGRVQPSAPVPPRRRRASLPRLVGATAVVFLLGLLAVTGFELLAGGPLLSSQQGTSVGRVLGYGPASGESDSPDSSGAAESSTAAPSSTTRTTTPRASSATKAPADASSESPSSIPTTSVRPSRTAGGAPSGGGSGATG
jgi:hypothetical protein